ncbi:MFS transporter [Streptomyces sp. NPDC057565]|uniref:MFS transporter n=1 Tax=Streptomyces sp. NPDC057565 TaxID=3346169 RepID=UPI0036CDD926
MLHDAAAISYLPTLVDRSLIQKSNSQLGFLFAIAASAGSNVGASLIGLLGPVRALTADVMSFLVSAWCTVRITAPEPTRTSPTGRLATEISDGVRYVFRDHALRTLTLVNATLTFGLGLLSTLWTLYLLRILTLSSTAFGVILGVGALGAAAGAAAAPRLSARYGPGPMMLAALALVPLTQIPLLLAAPGRGWQFAIGAALFAQTSCTNATGITQRSIRQSVTEVVMQARMQSVTTWLTALSRPMAALVAGALGTWIGLRPTLAAGAALLIVPFLVLYRSPLRTLGQIPTQQHLARTQRPDDLIPAVKLPGTTICRPTRARLPAPTRPGALGRPDTKETA